MENNNYPIENKNAVFKKQKTSNKWIIVALCVIGALILFAISSISTPESSGNSVASSTSSSDPSTSNSGTSGSSSYDGYIIEVSGTPGTEFTGDISSGFSNSRTVEGIVPATYTASDWPAVAVIQNKGDSGYISVSIIKNGELINSQSTSASYGVVTVSSDK